MAVSACPTIETERLVLRPFRDDDLDDHFAMMGSPEVRRWLHLPGAFDRDAAWAQMAHILGQWELRGTGLWALEERATGRFVGRAGLYNPVRVDWPGVEVGWALDPSFWGRGYATEAGIAARDYGFGELGLDRLYSCILPENLASQAVARRLGFTLLEERTMAWFPEAPHGIWVGERPDEGGSWPRSAAVGRAGQQPAEEGGSQPMGAAVSRWGRQSADQGSSQPMTTGVLRPSSSTISNPSQSPDSTSRPTAP
jgi:RimJ/RimL family protein N-acetyltransferase